MNVPPPVGPPWSPSERLELLTEILKANTLPPDALLPMVRQLPEPRWDDMPLPRGRSLNQCRALYYEYVRMVPPLPLARASSLREPPRPLDVVAASRQYAIEGPSSAPMAGSRYQDIQPRPATGRGGDASPPAEPPRKKRGRPTKAEAELKAAARQRAESISAPVRRDPAQPGPSNLPSNFAAQAAQAVMTPPLQAQPRPTAPQETSSGKRKRQKMMKSESEPRPSMEREVTMPEAQPGMYHARTPSRGYPDILSRHPTEGPSSFRAPRGGE